MRTHGGVKRTVHASFCVVKAGLLSVDEVMDRYRKISIDEGPTSEATVLLWSGTARLGDTLKSLHQELFLEDYKLHGWYRDQKTTDIWLLLF